MISHLRGSVLILDISTCNERSIASGVYTLDITLIPRTPTTMLGWLTGRTMIYIKKKRKKLNHLGIILSLSPDIYLAYGGRQD